MSKVVINDTSLTAIGEAIRSKTGNTDLLLPSEMPAAIESISGGGGGGGSTETVRTISLTPTGYNTETGEIKGITFPNIPADKLVSIFVRLNPNPKQHIGCWINNVSPFALGKTGYDSTPAGGELGVSQPMDFYIMMAQGYSNNINIVKPYDEASSCEYLAIDPATKKMYYPWKYTKSYNSMDIFEDSNRGFNSAFFRVDITVKEDNTPPQYYIPMPEVGNFNFTTDNAPDNKLICHFGKFSDYHNKVQDLGFDDGEDFLKRCVYLKGVATLALDPYATSDQKVNVPLLILPWLRQPLSDKDVPGGLDFDAKFNNVPAEYYNSPNCFASGVCDYNIFPNLAEKEKAKLTNMGPGYNNTITPTNRKSIFQPNDMYSVIAEGVKPTVNKADTAMIWSITKKGWFHLEEIWSDGRGPIVSPTTFTSSCPIIWFEIPKKQ